jgi:hypothetical protein
MKRAVDDSFEICPVPGVRDRSCVEFRAFVNSSRRTMPEGWPTTPGSISRGPDGRATLLHFAPDRWLAPSPSAETTDLINGAHRAGLGVAVDVNEKWRALRLVGTGVRRLLASDAFLDRVLPGRACAAVWLFDCPAILLFLEGNFECWVEASYEEFFFDNATRIHEGLLNPSPAAQLRAAACAREVSCR